MGFTHGETAIGEKSVGKVDLPKSFHRSNEGEHMLTIRPRKGDDNGPIFMQIMLTEDIKEQNLGHELINKILLVVDDDKIIEKVEGRLVSFSKTTFTGEDGIDRILEFRSIYWDGLLFTMTINTIKGREAEPQCKELHEQIKAIIVSLGRKPNKVK